MNYDLRIQLGRDTLCGVYSNDRFVREAAGRRERGAELRSERLITLRADWKIVMRLRYRRLLLTGIPRQEIRTNIPTAAVQRISIRCHSQRALTG